MNICNIFQNRMLLRNKGLFNIFTFSVNQSSIPLLWRLLEKSQPSSKTTTLGC